MMEMVKSLGVTKLELSQIRRESWATCTCHGVLIQFNSPQIEAVGF